MVQLLSNIKSISAGGDHSLALKYDSTVWMWGFDMNPPQRQSNPTPNDFLMPAQINRLSSITQISCGQNHNLFYKHDGTFWGLGEGGMGQLGNASYQFAFTTPQKVVCPCGSAITPTVSAGADISVCPNTNVMISATANGVSPFSYQWSTLNSNYFITRLDTVSPSIYMNDVSPGSTFTFSVIVSDNNLCQSMADSMVVTIKTVTA